MRQNTIEKFQGLEKRRIMRDRGTKNKVLCPGFFRFEDRILI